MKSIFHSSGVLIMAFVLFNACKKEDTVISENPETFMDVAYGSDQRQKMDVYLPANRSTATPLLLVLHGGGFVAGDKSEFTNVSKAFATNGYAVANINYQLVDTSGIFQIPMIHKPSAITIKEQLLDIKSATDFIASKVKDWNISDQRWAIAGHSAGGTLALLYGYSYSDVNADKRIKAVANWAGATDFSFQDESQFALLDPRLVEVYYRAVGREPKNANKLYYMAVSPYWIVNNSGGIPTLNIRPENNVVFNLPDGSAALYQAFTNILTAKNVPNTYIEIAGADHGFGKPGNWERVVTETSSFITQYAK